MPNRDHPQNSIEGLAAFRKEYCGAPLDPTTVADDPVSEFRAWFDLAARSGILEPNAMALATVSAEGQPSVRMVLLKDLAAAGLCFFSNYHSRKGAELTDNPRAALLFFWDRIERQVRIEGVVERMSAEDSNRYFASRPRGAQLGAAASPQSSVVPSREFLEERRQVLDAQHQAAPIPCPQHWGGYVLKPERFEFWQGREDRLHDRVVYLREGQGWRRERLAP